MKFGFIEAEKANYSVAMLCSVLAVSRAGFYKWRAAKPSKRATEDVALGKAVGVVFEKNKRRYGSPRVHDELQCAGVKTSRKRVARLMREERLVARPKTRRRVTTLSNDDDAVARNLLNRDFEATRPNEKWVADITYLQTTRGDVYLASIIDLFSRRVVGWCVSASLSLELTNVALEMALATRRTDEPLMHHSDRGSHYTSKCYGERLTSLGITRSMSRKGNCWDNAPMESFHSTLKHELPEVTTGRLRPQEVRREVNNYITWYNETRRHSCLGYSSPAGYEGAARLGRVA